MTKGKATAFAKRLSRKAGVVLTIYSPSPKVFDVAKGISVPKGEAVSRIEDGHEYPLNKRE